MMIICPNCHADIPSDSKYCDQCGQELMYCPECKEPQRGTECPRCGEDLIPARVYLSKSTASPVIPQQTSPGRVVSPQTPIPTPPAPPVSAPIATFASAPQGTVVAQSGPPALSIVGNAWSLPIKEGRFGRSGGSYPEFSTVPYISGNHGQFRAMGAVWEVQDMGSTNGTYLNGQRLAPGQWYPIKKGDSLKIATISFVIQ